MLTQELSFSTSHMYCVHLQAAVNLSGAQTPLQGNISSEMFWTVIFFLLFETIKTELHDHPVVDDYLLRLIWPLLTTLLWQLLSKGQDHLWKIKGTIEQNFCPFNIFWWVASVEKCESRRAAFPRKTLRYRLTRGESWSLADHRKNTAGADRDHAIIVSPSKSWSCDTFFMGFSFGLRSDKHQNTDCVFCFLLTLDSMITNMFNNVVGDWVEFLSRCSIFSFSTTNTQKGRAQEWLT